MRNVPDVALTADNVYVVYGNGQSNGFSGTSCAAPLWAGFTALINEQAVAFGQAPVGFLNQQLYAIGKGTNYTPAFHDITTGNNVSSNSPSRFSAVPGYDLCTGWGTPNGTNLISILAPPAPSVPSAPWIIGQPQSQTVTAGASAGFIVRAWGTAPLNYQWFFNGQFISPATNYSYSIARVQLSQAGRYTVVVTNSYGSVTSAPATLVVNPAQAPTITTQPQSQTVAAGANVTFSVIARGTAPLNYQWFFNGQPISTSTGSSYSIAGVQSSQAGTYTVMVSNPYGSVLSAPAKLVIASGSAFGIIGAPFIYQIVANNDPSWYSASGLPSGLSCDGATGLISGIPTQTGTFLVHVQARNFFGSASATLLFTIANGAITSAASAQGVIGVPFGYQIVANNSPTGYSASGLPSGLGCDAGSGLISGTPTQPGTFSVQVQARSIYGSASTNISLTISNGAIISATSAQGVIGVPFGYQIVANNSPTGYSASGLPSGLGCDAGSGLISGIPTKPGTFSVQVQARSIYGSASANISLSISNGAIVSATSAQGVIGVPFGYQIVADNSPTGYSASGLPSGLSCGVGSGLISGTPTQPGTFLVQVQARSIYGSASASLSLTISNGAIISATSAQGVIGAPFIYQIVANNSPTGYSASGLPSGLRCDAGSGLISGTPTKSGTNSVYVQARNFFGSASATISLTISAGTIGAASQPTLTVLRTGNGVLLTWPVTSDGFVLEETQVQPNAWTNSAAQVLIQGTTNAALVPIQSTVKFYRLRK